MKIYFRGCNYKYEVEAVIKLFIPLENFGFVFDGDDDTVSGNDDICKIISEDDLLSVDVTLNGKNISKNIQSKEASEKGFTDEAALCRMLFEILRDLTGISPEWGCLTGIRPVKKVNSLIAGGSSENDIIKTFSERYFTSPKKTHLAYLTALSQKYALENFRDNSYSLYISIPFCPSRCSYCSFVSHSIQSAGAAKLIPEYTDKLCEELEIISKIAENSGLVLDTIYIGGGTPTAISAEQLNKIMKKTSECFDISKIREYTVEAGRPDTITEEKLRVIKENGADRISVNPQTMNDSVLEAIGRKHTAEQFIKCFELARKIGFENINTDTIAGLPTDTPEGFRYTIDTLIGLSPEDITVHTLTVKRSSKLFADAEKMKTELRADYADEMVSYAAEKLEKSGYSPYYMYRQKNTVGNLENVGYSKKGRESLYNIYIMEENQTILAAGAGGSSKLYEKSTDRIERVVNFKYPYEYISRFDQLKERKKEIEEFFNDYSQRHQRNRSAGRNL